MNTGTLILSAFFITICALPFVLSSRRSRKRNNNLLKSLTTFADKHQAKISRYDIGSDFIIGLDDVNNLVFFLKKTEDKITEDYLDLLKYKDCRTLKLGKHLTANSNNVNAIEALKLEFIPNDTSSTIKQWEFYNEDVNSQLNGEIVIINTWQALIQQKLTHY